MKTKNSISISYPKGNNVKFGDMVRLIDGSSLNLHESEKDDDDTDYYIVFAYPSITGCNLNLKDIDAIVVKTDIKNHAAYGWPSQTAYIQDIVIMVGDAKFRTSSNHVAKLP